MCYLEKPVEFSSSSVTDNFSHADRMMAMLTNAEQYFSDVEIECRDGNIPCHSNILAAGADFFKVRFSVKNLN